MRPSSLLIFNRLGLAILTAVPLSSLASPAQMANESKEKACKALSSLAKARHLAVKSPGEYRCESVEDFVNRAYFVIGLKFWAVDVPKGFDGSNLVGWYAVRKSDDTVYELNVADWKTGSRIDVRN